MLIGILAMVLPTLPISLAEGYQGVVNENQYIALPVSFCIYFVTVFVIALVCWEIMVRFRMAGRVVVGILLCLVFTQIQIMNNAFSEVQYKYVLLLESQEAVFETDLLENLEIDELYAADLFEQHRTLAFHDSYWSEYAGMVGVDIEVINDIGDSDDWKLYSQGASLIVLTNGTELYVLSDGLLEGEQVVQVKDDKEIVVNFTKGVVDHEKYVYSFEIESDEVNIACNCE